jgi:hypothetical protein
MNKNEMNKIGCSEVVDVPTMGAYQGGGWDRINCPHEADGLVEFSSLFSLSSLTTGSNVAIASGQNVLLRQCHLPPNTTILNRISIASGGSLVFDDSNISLHGM